MAIYGYARCSTNEDMQDITRQKRELKKMGATDETIYFEYISGTSKNKVELERLLEKVKEGDTICTTEVSRLSRSTQQLCELMNVIKEKKLKLVILNSITIDFTKGEADPMSVAFLQMSGVFAELERSIISARVKSGMDNAKKKGKDVGRPKKDSIKDIPKPFFDEYDSFKARKTNIARMARALKVSRPTIYRWIEILENYNKEK